MSWGNEERKVKEKDRGSEKEERKGNLVDRWRKRRKERMKWVEEAEQGTKGIKILEK